MDLYLDFDHNSRRRRRGRRRGRRNRSRVPFVIGVIILLVVIVAGGIFAGRKYMAYRQQKAEEARKLAEARRVVTVMIPEGYSIDMIAKRLEKQGVFKADEFIKAAKNTARRCLIISIRNIQHLRNLIKESVLWQRS